MRSTFFYPVVKEIIPFMTFPESDVLLEKSEVELRKHDAKRAMALGNLERQKVRIFFTDAFSNKVVETTIWGLTDNYIILKSNTLIPMKRILRIQLI